MNFPASPQSGLRASFVTSNWYFMSPQRPYGRSVALLAFALMLPASALAQSTGTRAAGMGEAFVAVADDATSIYWNPAGMATGAFLSFVLDYGQSRAEPPGPDGTAGGSEGSVQFIAFTLPPFGLGYYRRSMAAAQLTPEGMAGQSREDGRQSVQALTTSNIGVTLAQSINEYIVVAGTVKFVQGEVTSGVTTARDPFDALDQRDSLAHRSTSRVDADAGAMVAVEQWRLGVVARNLTTPEFDRPEVDGGTVELEREVRVGAAWGSGWPGISRLVVSTDVDLTRQASMTGERRDVAAGVETWWMGQRLGLRGGLRGSTSGEARPVIAGGVSAAIKSGVFVEAHLAQGDQDERSWSVGARLTF
jgi:F plasmid transfer operon, TraF, protein